MSLSKELEGLTVIHSDNQQDQDFLNFLGGAATGNVVILNDFISRRPQDINKADDTYLASATHFAAKFNQLEALQFLVNHGAVLGRMTNKDLNEIHYGVNSVEVVEFILEQNPELINSVGQNGCTPRDCAILCESLEVVDLLRRKMLEISTEKQFGSAIAEQAEAFIAAAEIPNTTLQNRQFQSILENSQRTAAQGK